jgi:LysM repeat protein
MVTRTRQVGGTATLDAAALAAASLVVWAMLGWALITAVLAAVARMPGRPGSMAAAALRRVAPAAMRKALIAGVGISLLAGSTACGADRSPRVGDAAAPGAVPVATAPQVMAAPRVPSSTRSTPARQSVPTSRTAPARQSSPARSAATPHAARAQPQPDPGPAAGSDDLDWPVHRPAADPNAPLIDLDWPTTTRTRAAAEPTGPAAPARNAPAVVIVHTGDTLWALAERQLREAGGAPVTDALIDADWRLWYAANRSVIGGDPDLILPGQQLRIPALPAAPKHSATDTGNNTATSSNDSSTRTDTPTNGDNR